MAGIKKFVLTQFVTWLIAILIALFVIGSGLREAVIAEQLQTQRALDRALKSANAQEQSVEVLAKYFKFVFNLDRIIIRNDDDKVLFADEGNKQYLSSFASLVNGSSEFLRPQYAVNPALGYRVEFTIRIDEASQLAQQSAIYALFIITLLALIPFTLLKLTIHSASQRISEGMAKMVDDLIDKDDLTSTLDADSVNGSLSEVFPSIVRLNTFLRKKQAQIVEDAQAIKSEAYKDTVTELGNRNMFVEFYENSIESAEKSNFGTLALTRCTELQLINQTRGYQMGDEYVKDVAGLIERVAGTYTGSKIFRLNSSDFAVVIPNVPLKEAERYGDSLQSRFQEYQMTAELTSVGNTGIVSYESGKPLGEILASVDTALSLAQSKQTNAYHIQRESDLINNVSANFGNQNWRDVIKDVIDNERVQLMLQAIMPTSRGSKAYTEVLARFKTDDDQILPTSSFLAMAEKLDQAPTVDKLIIESTLMAIKHRNLAGQFFGINITARSAHDEQFIIWLERRLLKDSNISSRLVFEVSEFGFQQNVKASKRFIDMVHRVGARITVERFGVGLTSFKFFRDLKPDFIKMDASYTRGLEDDKNNQYFMRLMVDLAHRIGVSVLAEGVETQEEKHIIEQLCLDGVQGYYIEKPKEI